MLASMEALSDPKGKREIKKMAALLSLRYR